MILSHVSLSINAFNLFIIFLHFLSDSLNIYVRGESYLADCFLLAVCCCCWVFFPRLSLCFIDLYSLNPDLSYRTVVTEVNRFLALKWACFSTCFAFVMETWFNLFRCWVGFGTLCCYGYPQGPTLFKFIQWHLMFSVGYVLPVFINTCYTLIFRSSLCADLRGLFCTLLQLFQLFLSFIPSFIRLITIY